MWWNIKKNGEAAQNIKEAYRTLKSNIIFKQDCIRTLTIAAVSDEAASSQVCEGLGKAFADCGYNVCLVDSNMYHNKMDNSNAKGLAEYLAGNEKLSDIIKKTEVPGVDTIGAGNQKIDIDNERFDELLADLKNEYNYIFFNVPTLRTSIDAAIVASRCDASALVLIKDKDRCKEADKAIKQLSRSGSEFMGVILKNK